MEIKQNKEIQTCNGIIKAVYHKEHYTQLVIELFNIRDELGEYLHNVFWNKNKDTEARLKGLNIGERIEFDYYIVENHPRVITKFMLMEGIQSQPQQPLTLGAVKKGMIEAEMIPSPPLTPEYSIGLADKGKELVKAIKEYPVVRQYIDEMIIEANKNLTKAFIQEDKSLLIKRLALLKVASNFSKTAKATIKNAKELERLLEEWE